MNLILYFTNTLKLSEMALYHYIVENNTVVKYNQDFTDTLDDFTEYSDKSFGESTIHYKVSNKKIVEIVVDSELDESYARDEANDFLENLS